jgi:predicted phage baseplate assembly protein
MLLLPSLDKRSWDQLVEEARRQIPRLAPQWTDHNASDPGITLAELMAWVTETVLYRLDRVPPAMQRSFLRLLGTPPRPARVAQTILALTQAGAGPMATLPAGLQLGGADATGPLFETTRAIQVSPAMLATLAAVGAEGRVTPLPLPPAGTMAPFGAAPVAGAALLLGFDRTLAPGGTPLALFAYTADPSADAATRAALQATAADVPPGCTAPDWRLHYGVRTAWDYRAAGDRWLPLTAVEDETRALTLSGFLRFAAPPDAGPDAHVAEAGRYLLRCRMLSGTYDRAPTLAGLAWNAVPAAHAAATAAEEVLAERSQGWAEERFRLAQRPVVPGSTRLTVQAGGTLDHDWRECADLDRSGPWDAEYALDAAAGELAFGDGRRGRVLPAGATLALRYRVGGGAAGNLAAGWLDRVVDTAANRALLPGWPAPADAIRIAQPIAAFGGAEADSERDAAARAVLALEQPDKAVTAGDLARLALATPGAPVARAWAIPEFHPSLPQVRAAGCVGLVIVSDGPGPAPAASPPLLAAVAAWLAPRRLVTTELSVIAACYRTVAVEAVLHPAPDADVAGALTAARAALDSFLHPLAGGPDGAGWPAGRAVYRAEIEALLAGIAGIAAVTAVVLRAGDDPPLESCDAVALCPQELVRAGDHALRTPDMSPPPRPSGRPPHGCC